MSDTATHESTQPVNPKHVKLLVYLGIVSAVVFLGLAATWGVTTLSRGASNSGKAIVSIATGETSDDSEEAAAKFVENWAKTDLLASVMSTLNYRQRAISEPSVAIEYARQNSAEERAVALEQSLAKATSGVAYFYEICPREKDDDSLYGSEIVIVYKTEPGGKWIVE
jgi:hypothetical protein